VRPAALDQPSIASRYEILRYIDEGAMGQVYHVQNRHVSAIQRALKLILPGKADAAYRDRFLKEAKIAATLEGEHIAKLFEYAVCEDGTPYAIWEYIAGKTLDTILATEAIPPLRALRLMEQVAAGLCETHRVAIHRDIKPGNLMVREEGAGTEKERLIILDFGIAKPRREKVTTEGGKPMNPGTPAYMAPELWEGLLLDPSPSPAQDIYAAGIVMYELLAGHLPYDGGNSLQALWAAIKRAEPKWEGCLQPHQYGGKLHAIIKRAIHKNRNERFPNAEEFRAAIVDAIDYVRKNPALVEPPPPPPPPQPVRPAFDEYLNTPALLGAAVKPVPSEEGLAPQQVRIPKFMLFKRGGQVVLAIVDRGAEVNPLALQKTNEIQAKAVMLKGNEMRKIGFIEGQVHPIFSDPSGRVGRIMVDALLLAQAQLFPDSLILLPAGNNGKMLVPCHAALTALHHLHGERLIYGNIAKRENRCNARWHNDPTFAVLLEQQPIKARFAPTPSGLLHMGNARAALASYLLYRRRRKQQKETQFHIRIDDTDDSKSEEKFIGQILTDLQALGIDRGKYPCFKQSDLDRNQIYYSELERILDMAGLVFNDATGVTLRSRWESYTNFWLDWRDGPMIDHQPPMSDPHTEWEDEDDAPSTVERPKERAEKNIPLIRAKGENPYYRYAGIVDDVLPFVTRPSADANGVRPITYVVRDNKQRDLTKVQSHIRAALEEARKKLAGKRIAERIFREIGLDHQRPLPLPIYLHLPLVVSADGKKLSKRTPDPEYLISRLLQNGILQETLVAYLIWTLIPRPRTGRQSLDEVVTFTARYGIECAIARFAEELDCLFLTQMCEKNLSCDLRLLRKANLTAIRAMLPWRFRLHLAETAPGNEIAGNFSAAWMLFVHRKAFGNWNDVLAVAQGPSKDFVIAATTKQTLRNLLQQHEPTEAVEAVAAEVAAARFEIKKSRRVDEPPESARVARAFLQDMRLLLTGAERSPAIHEILTMLDKDTVINRLRKAEQWATM
jgi:serine/threonine protein kinase/glutamyl/glutaminyl-tRNA synthetase